MNIVCKIKFNLCIAFFVLASFKGQAKLRLSECLIKSTDSLFLSIEFQQASESDTLVLRMGDYFVGDQIIGKSTHYRSTQKENGKYYFSIAVTDASGYFDLYAPRKKIKREGLLPTMAITYPQFWEAGDSIDVKISHKETITGIISQSVFSGKGAEKYEVNERIKNNKMFLEANFNNITQEVMTSSFPETIQDIINGSGHSMSKKALLILKMNLWFRPRWEYLQNCINRPDIKGNEDFIKALCHSLENESNFHADTLLLLKSKEYLKFSFMRMKFLDKFLDNTDSFFKTTIKKLKGHERELILSYYFEKNEKSENIDEELKYAETIIHDSTLRNSLVNYGYRNSGKQWIDYKLMSENQKEISLSEFDDKIVVIDFWFTGCGNCTLYYKNVLSKIKQKFKKQKTIVFLSISIDSNYDLWKKSVKSGIYTSESTINLYTGGRRANHPILHDNKISAFPFVVLLNKNRVLEQYNSQRLYSLQGLENELNKLLN